MIQRLFLALTFSGLFVSAAAHAEETKRDGIVAEFDANGDKRLKGKEMRAFRDDRPKLYADLLAFCEVAKEDPKAHGVKLPAKPKGKDKKCKKSHVSKYFLNAWTDLGKPLTPPEPEQEPGTAKVRIEGEAG